MFGPITVSHKAKGYHIYRLLNDQLPTKGKAWNETSPDFTIGLIDQLALQGPAVHAISFSFSSL
jgi:hypothetical protein